MGYGIETVLAFLSDAATATAQDMTPGLTQSFNIRATAGGSAPVTCEAVMANFQDIGELRVRSPRMHDDVNGIRFLATAGNPEIAALEAFTHPLYSQDTLIVEAVFTAAPVATHISIAGLQIYYQDVPGIQANYRHWAEVQPQIVDYLAVPVIPTSSATAGNWGTGVAINSTVDVFRANTLYALMGYLAPTGTGLWSILGVDIGNLQVGGLMGINPVDSRRWFYWMDANNAGPSIPIINSQNKGTTLVQVADQTASTARTITLLFARLAA